jgi:hypothetical protein
MKILSLRKNRYLARVSIFLLTVVLIAGTIGCAGGGYNLTISGTAGGNVTTPGVGVFLYDAGAVVNLVATPDARHRFVKWTGDVGRPLLMSTPPQQPSP